MASAPRVYLFHGSDSRASLEALHRWEAVFLQKFGYATRYVIEADEVSLDIVRKEIAQRVEAQALFPEPKLVIVKRLASHEKGKTALLGPVLDFVKGQAGAECTVVFWEDRLLPERSGMRAWFTGAETSGFAKVTAYSVPHPQDLPRYLQATLKEKGAVGIEKDAVTWIVREYGQIEKAARLVEKLKATEPLSRDPRGWWLNHVLEQAVVIAGTQTISVEHVRAVALESRSISVFEIVNALRDADWGRCRTLLREWAREQDDAGYFGLWSLLRMQLRRQAEGGGQGARHGLRLLAELEILSKNAALPYEVITDAFFLALATKREHIVSPKQLWLSTLPLS